MQIIFNPNINLFKNKKHSQIINMIPKYKRFYKPIFSKFILEVGIEEKCIHSISIIPDKSSYGTTRHFYKDGSIYFDIELSDEIIPYISFSQNSTETFKAKSIFQHELFHCKEIKYIYENHIFYSTNPLDQEFEITSTYNFLFDEAVKLWSEFYAFYNNRSINWWHEVPDVRIDIKEVEKWFLASYKIARDSENSEIKICKDMFKTIHSFWYNMVSMIALHMQSEEDILIEDFNNSEIPFIKAYFQCVYDFLKVYNEFYPDWLSEEKYIKFGKVLMSIMKFYHLDFSTDDLSDNFILKYVP